MKGNTLQCNGFSRGKKAKPWTFVQQVPRLLKSLAKNQTVGVALSNTHTKVHFIFRTNETQRWINRTNVFYASICKRPPKLKISKSIHHSKAHRRHAFAPKPSLHQWISTSVRKSRGPWILSPQTRRVIVFVLGLCTCYLSASAGTPSSMVDEGDGDDDDG